MSIFRSYQFSWRTIFGVDICLSEHYLDSGVFPVGNFRMSFLNVCLFHCNSFWVVHFQLSKNRTKKRKQIELIVRVPFDIGRGWEKINRYLAKSTVRKYIESGRGRGETKCKGYKKQRYFQSVHKKNYISLFLKENCYKEVVDVKCEKQNLFETLKKKKRIK